VPSAWGTGCTPEDWQLAREARMNQQSQQANNELEVRMFARSGLVSPPVRPPGPICAMCGSDCWVLSKRMDDVEVELCEPCRHLPQPQPMGPTRTWWLWPLYILAGRW
jgi:hypothetical protein